MLTNFFSKTKPINSLVLGLVFFGLYFLQLFLSNSQAISFSFLAEHIGICMLHLLFLLLSGVLVLKSGVVNENLYASFFMVLAYVLFPKSFGVDVSLLISFILLFIYYKLSSQLNAGLHLSKLFDSGMLLGVAFLIDSWMVVFLPMIFISTFIVNAFSLRTVLVSLVGFLVPSWLYFVYALYFKGKDSFFSELNFSINNFSDMLLEQSSNAPLQILTVVTIISLMVVLPKVISVSNNYRSQFYLIILFLCFGCLYMSISPFTGVNSVLILFVTFSVVLGRFVIVLQKEKVKEIFLLSTALLALVKLFLIV